MKKLILLFLCVLPYLSQAKDYEIKIHVRNFPDNGTPVLVKMYNGDLLLLDSTAVREQETLTFHVPEETPRGTLRAILGMPVNAQYMSQPTSIDFLFAHENVELALDYNQPAETIEVIQSEENRIYFNFLKQNRQFYRKLGLIEQVIVNYPEPDDFYSKAVEQFEKLQVQRDKYVDKSYNTHRKTFAGRIIKLQKLPITAGSLSRDARDSVFREHFLDDIDFSDTTLLYTNVYTDKIFQYIQLYMNREAGPRENEANIIKAVDLLIPHLEVNPTVEQHILQFMLKGFEAMKLEEVLAHISSNYMQQCGGDNDIVRRRLEGYQKMAIGKQVPDFTVTDIQNQPFNLYSQITPYTLIIFWHTGCSHCELLLEQLPGLMAQDFFKQHQVTVVGISIDEERQDWEKFSAAHSFDWINAHAEGDFDSQVAKDYNLFATPTMFLIDNAHTILAKPLTFDELKKEIQKL